MQSTHRRFRSDCFSVGWVACCSTVSTMHQLICPCPPRQSNGFQKLAGVSFSKSGGAGVACLWTCAVTSSSPHNSTNITGLQLVVATRMIVLPHSYCQVFTSHKVTAYFNSLCSMTDRICSNEPAEFKFADVATNSEVALVLQVLL